MASAVLPAQDFLARYQSHTSADFMGFIYPKKSHQHPQSKRKSGHGHGFSPQKSKVKGENPEKNGPGIPNPRKNHFSRRAEGLSTEVIKSVTENWVITLKKDTAKNPLSMGQVTILKRGQALKPNNNDSSQLQIADKTTGPLFVSPNQIVHQDRTLLSQDRTMKSRSVSSMGSEAATPPGFETEIAEGGNGMKTPSFPVFISEKWAGPAFTNSPSPSSLPLPSFSIKKSGQESAEIDRFATRDEAPARSGLSRLCLIFQNVEVTGRSSSATKVLPLFFKGRIWSRKLPRFLVPRCGAILTPYIITSGKRILSLIISKIELKENSRTSPLINLLCEAAEGNRHRKHTWMVGCITGVITMV